jgi:hypothetical protein
MLQTGRGIASKIPDASGNNPTESLARGEDSTRDGSVRSVREGSTVGILPGILPVERYTHNDHRATPGSVLMHAAESLNELSDC